MRRHINGVTCLASKGPVLNLPFRDQTPHSISGRPRIIAAPPEGLDEINAALD